MQCPACGEQDNIDEIPVTIGQHTETAYECHECGEVWAE